jgi:hypothetical protein
VDKRPPVVTEDKRPPVVTEDKRPPVVTEEQAAPAAKVTLSTAFGAGIADEPCTESCRPITKAQSKPPVEEIIEPVAVGAEADSGSQGQEEARPAESCGEASPTQETAVETDLPFGSGRSSGAR